MSENFKNYQILTCSCPFCKAIKQSFYPIDFYYYPMQESNLNKIHSLPEQTQDLSRREVDKKVELPAYIINPIYEFRGVWVTTVRNNDFPSRAVFANGEFDLDLFKREYMAILKHCKSLNLNAIFFQVRPQGDAFYQSTINPWSEYLTGKQGVEPEWGDFDPLTWMITMTHGAGLEFHAWFNPFRLSSISKEGKSKSELINRLVPNHFAKKNQQYVYFFDGQIFLDPGFPQVRQHVIDSVMEVVREYAIDAVHFDDYFYPYAYQTIEDDQPVEISFNDLSPDLLTYEKYHKEGQSIKDWRESNINDLIYNLSQRIHGYNKRTNKSIAFGISPFGVWASATQFEGVGSNTSPYQLSSLDEYVDSKLWVEEEWIDYLVPQNYWAFSDPLSPFGEVANWWNEIFQKTHTQLYMGLGLYLYEESEDSAWENEREIANQIIYTRLLSHVEGFALFTYHNLVKEPQSSEEIPSVLNLAISLLEERILKNKSLIPPRDWLQSKGIKPVSGLQVRRCEDDNCLVFYDQLDNNSQYYVIYRMNGIVSQFDFNNPETILEVIGRNYGETMQNYTDIEIDENQTYTYVVTALSQAQVQSLAVAYVFEP